MFNYLSPLRGLYHYSFHKKFVCPQGVFYNPSPALKGRGEYFDPKFFFFYQTVDYFEQTGNLKILIGGIRGKEGVCVWGG